jgi:CHAT domain
LRLGVDIHGLISVDTRGPAISLLEAIGNDSLHQGLIVKHSYRPVSGILKLLHLKSFEYKPVLRAGNFNDRIGEAPGPSNNRNTTVTLTFHLCEPARLIAGRHHQEVGNAVKRHTFNQAAADAVFKQLFDPRRELLIVVEEAERSAAERALARLHAMIDSEIGGKSLLRAAAFRSAAAQSLQYNPFDSIQIIVAHRDWAPPVVQMLLDLAAIRRLSVEDVPVLSEGGVNFTNIKGNPFLQRRDATLCRDIATMEELSERYCRLTRKAFGDIVAQDPSAPEQIMKVVAPTVPRRPAFLLPRNPDTKVTAIPYLRHLGALPLPSGEGSLEFLESLRLSEIYATAEAAAGIPAGDWAVRIIPEQPLRLTRYFQEQTQKDYQKTLDDLPHAHPHLVAMRQLLEEMKPAEYVVLSTNRETERAWAYLAANYAGALHAPLMLADMSVRSEAKTVDPDLWGPVILPKMILATVPTLDKNVERALSELAPVYVGYVSPNVGRAIELMGSPPLATRFAVGRLSGPDLASTALLITRAALSEDVARPANIQAVLVDCAEAVPSRPLPGVHKEVDAIRRLFDHESDISMQLLEGTSDAHDKSTFLRSLPTAHLVHFAGHGYYDPVRPERSGLQFHEGVMIPGEMSSDAVGAPIVFSNACETGLLTSVESSHGELAWSGLAASFIARGAVNYLGSLSPIFDDSSAQFASRFYRLLVDGKSVGEALLHARVFAYDHNDRVWDTYVLFGCPRNRMHAR